MNRYRFVIRSYPTDTRNQLGDEIVETANLLAPQGWSLRQSASLLAGGLRTRATASTGRSPRTTWAIGLRSAILFQFITVPAGLIAFQLGARGDISSISPSVNATIAAALAVVTILTLTTRWPAAVALTAFAVWIASDTFADPLLPTWVLGPPTIFALITIGAGWWLALACDGRRASSPISAVLFFSASFAVAHLANDPDLAISRVGLPVALLIVGLLLVSIDPRPLVFLGCLIALTLLPQLPLVASDTFLTQSVATLAAPVGAIAALLAIGHRSTTLHTRTS